MPPQQQRRAGFERELAKPPLLDENDHPVKRERDGEQVDAHLVGYGVAVVENVVRRERHERGGERRPSVGEDAGQRAKRQHRGGGVEGEHQDSRRENLPRKVVPERQPRELYERGAPDREAPVHLINGGSVVTVELQLAVEPEEGRGRQILGEREILGRIPPVEFRAVEMRAVAAEDEDRRQRQRQKRDGKPRPALLGRRGEAPKAARHVRNELNHIPTIIVAPARDRVVAAAGVFPTWAP